MSKPEPTLKELNDKINYLTQRLDGLTVWKENHEKQRDSASWPKSKSGKSEWKFFDKLSNEQPELASKLAIEKPTWDNPIIDGEYEYWLNEGTQGTMFVNRKKIRQQKLT